MSLAVKRPASIQAPLTVGAEQGAAVNLMDAMNLPINKAPLNCIHPLTRGVGTAPDFNLYISYTTCTYSQPDLSLNKPQLQVHTSNCLALKEIKEDLLSKL